MKIHPEIKTIEQLLKDFDRFVGTKEDGHHTVIAHPYLIKLWLRCAFRRVRELGLKNK